MFEVDFSKHAKHMLLRRRIPEEWVWRAINTPDKKNRGDDDNMHYTKTIREKSGQVLHVVINPNVQPNRIVTLFFDRREGKKR
ncbi:DUF4258 domain-containing protein [candidate division KSB1 bacterium]|nr:DUF4258 domain-containing protein [candidate division KSB1 bacterium]